jgi:HK97 family phage portal protein
MYSQYVNPITSGNPVFPISGYEYYWNSDDKQILSIEDVVHLKWANPKYVYGGQYFGVSPMKVAEKIIQKQNNIDNTSKNQIGNGGPRAIAFMDGGDETLASSMQQDDFKESFKKYAANGDSHIPLSPVPLGKITLDESVQSMGLIESSSDGLRTLSSVLSFPSVLLNDNASSTYNNVSEARRSAWTDCITRHLDVFANGFTRAIISEEDIKAGICFKWDYSEITELMDDQVKKETANKSKVEWMRRAYFTPNEIREAMGMNPINDSSMNQPYFSTSELPMEDMGTMNDNVDPS